MTFDLIALFLMLMLGHVIADFGLQSKGFCARKRRRNEPDDWWRYITVHATTHGMFVSIFTGSILLGVCELIAHFLIDWAKCEKWYGFWVDQLLHTSCKIIWIAILLNQM